MPATAVVTDRREPNASGRPQGNLLNAQPHESQLLERLLGHVTCTVLQAGCWLPVPPEWSLQTRGRPSYTLWICVGGSAEYTLAGRHHPMRAGSVILAPPHVPREGRHDPADPLHLYTVHFTARLYGVFDMPVVYRLPEALRLAPARMERVVAGAQQIVAELTEHAPGYVLVANGRCTELLGLVWREAALQAGRAVPDDGDAGNAAPADTAALPPAAELAALTRLAPVFQLVQARYAEPLTLADLAAPMHLHPAYFSTVFKLITGLSPMRYLRRYRLDRVRELLLSSDLPVSEIASLTGYNDPAYLDRVFRQVEGMTPTAYRVSKKSPLFS